jgi:hypothetical protein
VLFILVLLAITLLGPVSAFASGGSGGSGGGGGGGGGGRNGADDPANHDVAPGGGGGGGATRPRAEVRVTGSCGSGAQAWLKLKENSGSIEVEFEVHHARPGAVWRLAIVHERRIEYRGRHRTRSTGAMDISERLADLRGADTVLARAWGPRGVTCTASAVMPSL